MKKLISFLGLLMLILTSTIFTSCSESDFDVPGEPIEFKGFKSTAGKVINDNEVFIYGVASDANEFIYYDLKEWAGKEVVIEFMCDMKTSSKTGANLMWQLLDSVENKYPIVVNEQIKDEYKTIGGVYKYTVKETNDFFFYLSTYTISNESRSNLKIWIKNLKFSVYEVPEPNQNPEDEWLAVPSLKDAYDGKIDYIGMSVVGNEINDFNIQRGLSHHFNSITMGNEMKPDSILGWQVPSDFEDFEDSYNTKVKVPTNVLKFSDIDKYLQICKDNGLKMRGHVLVWHSQTPAWFFNSNYSSNGPFVDEATMTARQEWYIKSVLEHIKDWEDKNNDGERIIYCWDVVNEAAEDGTTTALRSESNWYNIYKDDEFIVNAFRFANKYAPKDVLLAYNDYQEYNPSKRAMILKIIKSVQSHENDSNLPTRIDVLGMQSHNKYGNPTMSNYEDTIKEYLATGLDVHITELDIGAISTDDARNSEKLKKEYKDSYKLYLKYAKKGDKPGISSVTIWGISDKSTWLNTSSQLPWLNYTYQYPLLFDENYYAKPAFYGVLEAAQESN